jgi:hypothetical protein
MNGKQTNYILLITFNKYQDIYLPVKNNLMYQTANTIKTLINNNTRHRPLAAQNGPHRGYSLFKKYRE